MGQQCVGNSPQWVCAVDFECRYGSMVHAHQALKDFHDTYFESFEHPLIPEVCSFPLFARCV